LIWDQENVTGYSGEENCLLYKFLLFARSGNESETPVHRLDYVKEVKVKQSRYRPGVAQRVPGS